VAQAASATPENDFIVDGWPNFWFKTDDAANVAGFSAVCLLFAKNLAQKLGNKVRSQRRIAQNMK
jgi:hypothetical protein